MEQENKTARFDMKTTAIVEIILSKETELSKTKSPHAADIDASYLSEYWRISRLCRDEKDLGLRNYPYKLFLWVSHFLGGYF